MYELNDDMDELFRRAAKEYPLNTGNSDWDKVLKGLQEDDDSAAALLIPEKTPRKSRRRFLWLPLPLLLLSLALYNYMSTDKGTNRELAQLKKADDIKVSSAPRILSSTSAPEYEVTTNVVELSKSASFRRNPEVYENRGGPDTSGFLLNNAAFRPAYFNNNDANHMNATAFLEKEDSAAVIRSDAEKNKTSQTAEKDSIASKTPVKIKSHPKSFYIGLTAGPDISSIKWQSVKNVGLNGGLIIGYQLNRRFSVESGVLWNKKYYHSDGEYFSTKNIRLPPNTKIQNLDGDCRMIEWPVNVRYNINPGRTGIWSVSAGVSSYFMKKEYYNYAYLYANGQVANRERMYNNASENWFSVINIGFNYSRPIGKTTRLRIEPYFKVPVKGIGVGSLPIMSSGLKVDFIKKIF